MSGVGRLAYELRSQTGETWLELADRLDYRVGEDPMIRQRGIFQACRSFAHYGRHPWPVGKPGEAVAAVVRPDDHHDDDDGPGPGPIDDLEDRLNRLAAKLSGGSP